MVTLAVSLTFIGFFLTYNTSKRAILVDGPIRKWAKKNPGNTNIIGILFLITGLVSTIYTLGWTAGIFSYLVVLMTLASLTVLVSPLHFFSLKGTVIIAIVLLLVEINLS